MQDSPRKRPFAALGVGQPPARGTIVGAGKPDAGNGGDLERSEQWKRQRTMVDTKPDGQLSRLQSMDQPRTQVLIFIKLLHSGILC